MVAGTRARRWGALAAEAGGALLLVLALFWIFIVLLYALFPSGTPLKEMIGGSPEPAATPAERSAEATLSSLMREVRLRRGNSIAWGGAREGMQLFSQDAVQTFDRSGATISFGARDRLSVGSNSLVVVTRLNARDETGPRSYRVQVAGELRGSLSAARKLRLEFAAAGHLARVEPGAARFRVSPNADNSASLAVYAGEVQIVGKGGKVRVPANFGVTLREGVLAGRAVALPAAPVPAAPVPAAPVPGGPERAVYRYRLLPPRVRFTWSGGGGDYHFQLSKTARFDNCLLDQRLAAPELVSGKLTKGSYFWRVSRVEEGREGLFSRTGRCELQQLLRAPALSVSFPPESAPAGPYTVSGETEPGSRVFLDGSELATGSAGEFSHEVRLKPGVNLIRVESLDPAGNASYASRIVYGRL
ncbi:MAG TPA: hypothetical protein VIK40_10920 [Geomonas sp.]